VEAGSASPVAALRGHPDEDHERQGDADVDTHDEQRDGNHSPSSNIGSFNHTRHEALGDIPAAQMEAVDVAWTPSVLTVTNVSSGLRPNGPCCH
jgi:hypothetical protein